MRLLKACLSILRIQLVSGLQFRMAAWAKVSTFVFWGFVQVVLVAVFYRFGSNPGAGANAGMTFAQAVSYTWLVQVVAHLLPIMSTDNEVWTKIRNGDVGIELCRPLDLYAHWFARAAATRLSPFLLQVVPITTIAMLVPEPYRLKPPASIQGLLAALLALSAGLLLSCSCVGLTYALLMNARWGEGPTSMLLIIIDALSGSYLPLQLWPGWAQRFLLLQPFAGIIDIPLRLYTGTMPPGQVWPAIGLQMAWTVLFTSTGWLWMRKSFDRMIIQGG